MLRGLDWLDIVTFLVAYAILWWQLGPTAAMAIGLLASTVERRH